MSRLLSWLMMAGYCGCWVVYLAAAAIGLLLLLSWFLRLWWWW